MSETGDQIQIPKSNALSLEVERAFFERVNVTHHQDGDEAEHAPPNQAALRDRLFVNHRPWVHEHDLEIEEDKQHRHQIKLHAEARLGFALRYHSTFIGRVFGRRTAAGLAQKHANYQS